jgi:hypothetical protein
MMKFGPLALIGMLMLATASAVEVSSLRRLRNAATEEIVEKSEEMELSDFFLHELFEENDELWRKLGTDSLSFGSAD